MNPFFNETRRPIEEDGDTNEDQEDINEEDTDPKNGIVHVPLMEK